MKDLDYLTTGFFTTFFPNTPAGENAWKSLAEQTNGSGKILTMHLQSTLAQLRKAGYSVGKAKKPTMSIDDILNELEA